MPAPTMRTSTSMSMSCWVVTSTTLGTHRLVEPGRLAVVDELQRHLEVGLFQHRDDGLQVVALLAGDADLVALDLGLDGLGTLVANELGDLLGILAVDALL